VLRLCGCAALTKVYALSTDASHAHEPTTRGGVAPYGVLVMARRSLAPHFERTALPTQMQRTLVTAKMQVQVLGSTRTFKAATVHLESLANAATRRRQLETARRVLAIGDGDCVLTGDFNFDDRRPWSDKYTTAASGVDKHMHTTQLENDSLAEVLPQFVDLWPALRGRGEPGFTFDTVANRMLTPWHGYEQMRYDRIMARLASTPTTDGSMAGWQPHSIRLLFDTPIGSTPAAANRSLSPTPTELYVSDHFGLVAELIWHGNASVASVAAAVPDIPSPPPPPPPLPPPPLHPDASVTAGGMVSGGGSGGGGGGVSSMEAVQAALRSLHATETVFTDRTGRKTVARGVGAGKEEVLKVESGAPVPDYLRSPCDIDGLMDDSACVRFAPDSTERWLEHLHREGYVVLADVLSPVDVTCATDLLWDWLHGLGTGIRREDASTWDDSSWVANASNGIMGKRGVHHSDFMWFVRLQPKVRAAFATVWGIDETELISSFDCANMFRPWQAAGKPEWKTHGGWWHVDQNALPPRSKRGQCAVQGLVTLTDATADSGGLCVIPRSHSDHAQLCQRALDAKRISKHSGDFVPVPQGDPLLSGAVRPRLVTARAGDLLLWDSRTVHCNTPATAARPQAPLMPAPPSEPSSASASAGPSLKPLRTVCYVCMTPASKASRKTLEQRALAFEYGVGSTHWPHEFVPTGPMPTGSTPRHNRGGPSLCSCLCGSQPPPEIRSMPPVAADPSKSESPLAAAVGQGESYIEVQQRLVGTTRVRSRK
jgi:endonuclease/exonuclease/phosphatase family metal-dependent hydrolase/ectoine hydroxylase-related dioxygenase (phytanoyl-CoA dioxygenase family)